ncbi:MAG: gliding motility-associated C-terminal domain-containing protein, partial [Chitinophagaceae bacterium]
STTNLSICPSDLPYSWNGLTFTAAGSQTKTGLVNSQGCDSTATLNLTVKTNTASTQNISVCPSDLPYTWNGLSFTAAGAQTKTGLVNSQGCDSTATLNLTVKTNTASTQNISVCPSDLPYSWNGLNFTAAGAQTYHTTNSQGCDSLATLNLKLKTQPIIAVADTFRVWSGSQVILDAQITNAQEIKWLPGTYLNLDTIEKPTATPQNSIAYSIKATSSEGCISLAKTYIKLYKELVIVNAFSPNNDGINDVWDLSVLSDFSNIKVQVFTRGGNVVFQSLGYNKPWNGTNNGQPLPVGTYYYIIDVPGYKKMSGSVTILK